MLAHPPQDLEHRLWSGGYLDMDNGLFLACWLLAL